MVYDNFFSARLISCVIILPSLVYFPCFKGTVMQIEKMLINDRLRVSKAFWKFRILAIYNMAVIYP